MPIQTKKQNTPKLRALLVYDADREIDVAHPLYNEIMLYGEALEEVHVFVFIKNLPLEKWHVANLSENIFAYYLPSTGLFLEIDKVWALIKYHIVWNKKFRPDFILNFSISMGSFIGYFLARKYHRHFFVSTSGSFVEMPKTSWSYISQYLLLKGAQGVFVPGEKIADALINHAGVPNEKISVVRPAVDMSFLSRTVESIDYLKRYPQHNFFLLTRVSVGHKRDLAFMLKIFSQVVNRYTRMALIIIVPPEQVTAIKNIVAESHNPSIYVFPEGDDVISYYGGAQIFLSITESEEMTIPIVCALSLHVPVVTTEAGVAKEIFSGSRYQEFMKPFGDVDGYSKAVFKLIENQQLRNEYRLNSPMLLNSLTLQTLQGQVATVLTSIQERNK